MANTLWYGFNMLWMFALGRRTQVSPKDIVIKEKELDFISNMGCNFIRVPLDYRFWIHNFDYYKSDEVMLECVDKCIEAVVSRGLHCSLNMHRAPGYCINGANLEKHNLWKDIEAEDAFVHLWKELAERYSSYTSDQLSFDLLNEPPNIGQYGMTREIHERIIRRVVAEIRSVSPERKLVIDGLGGGNIAMPELSDLGLVHSTRGYQPMALTHYKAEWCDTSKWPKPEYPGFSWENKVWDKSTLLACYDQWKELSDKGVPVHIGECGCYNKVNNKEALRWFTDFFSVCKTLKFGYALWNFKGDFGIIGHNRPDTRWEMKDGFLIDRDLYELFIQGMSK